MNKKTVDNIVWYIPFKKIRNNIRDYMNTIVDNQNTMIYNQNTMIYNQNAVLNEIISNGNIIYYYDMFLSVGSNCNTAEMLKRFNLRTFSSPFDWLMKGPNCEGRLKILENKFSGFCDKKSDFVYEGQLDQGSHSYENKNTSMVHIHDFFNSSIADEEFKNIKDKYDRRINRTLDKIKSSKKIMLVYFGSKESFNKDILSDNLKRLKEVYNKDFNLLYVANSGDLDPSIHFEIINENIHFYITNTPCNKNYDFWFKNLTNNARVLFKYRITPAINN